MEQRDLLKEQIEQVGRVLGKILADFLGLKTQGNSAQAISFSKQQLNSELDIDLEKILNLSGKALATYLKDRLYSEENIELLVDYLYTIGKNDREQGINSSIYLRKAIDLLEIADELSNTISFDRHTKKQQIQSLLSD